MTIKNEIAWSRARLPIGENDVVNIQNSINFIFPDDFKEIISLNNSATPDKRGIDTLETKGREFLRFLSVRPEDPTYIPEIMKNVEFLQEELIPIAMDSGGDFFCYDRSSKDIVFWDHETSKTEFVAKSITELLEKLYS
jgi:hypothetical protein